MMVLSERITHFYTDPCPIKPTVRIRKLIINVLWAFLTLNQYILLRIWMLKLYTCITMWLLWTFILHGLNISSINEVKKFSLRTLQELSKTAYFTCTHYFIQKWTFCIKLSFWIFQWKLWIVWMQTNVVIWTNIFYYSKGLLFKEKCWTKSPEN